MPAVRSVSESGAAQEPAGNMRLGLHVEQRVGVKRQLHLLRQQLATASADLQVGQIFAQHFCLVLHLPAAHAEKKQLHMLWLVRLGVPMQDPVPPRLVYDCMLLTSGRRMMCRPSVQSCRSARR